MNKELLTQAKAGDAQALATLRRTTPASLTVFVAPGGDVDVAATLAAYEYYKLHNIQPDEWDDEPTVTFAQAFPVGVRRNPLTLKPVTPGLWTRLWDSKDGHKFVAGIHWGKATRTIQESDIELKLRVRQHLEAPDALLIECARLMERDKNAYSMKAVNAPVEQVVSASTIVVVPGVGERTRLQTSLAELEQEYNRGMLDFGRYMRLKETLTSDLQAAYGVKWKHDKAVALRSFIIRAYNLNELQTLCFSVGLRYDDLGGSGLSAKALGFIDNRQRRGLLDEVAELCRQQRPALWIEMMGRYE